MRKVLLFNLQSKSYGSYKITRYKNPLIFITLSLFNISTIHADLLVVFLQSSHILSSFAELSLLHTLAHVPVHESPLGIHQVKLVVQPSPSFSDGSGVTEHADGSLYFSEVSSWDDGGWLIVNADLEPSGAPVHKLNTALGLDGSNCSIDILWHHISSIKEAAGHVLTMPGITLDHGVGWFEASVGYLGNIKLLVVSLLSRDDGGIRNERKVNTGIRNQVGLEFIQIHVQGSVESQRSSDRTYNLRDQAVKIGVGGPLDVEVSAADIIDGLVVHHERTITVLQGGVGAECGVVGLHHSCGHLGSRVDAELQLCLLPVVHGESLHEEGSEARASTSSKGMEDEEALKAGAVVSQLTDSVQHQVNDLLAHGVVASGVIVGSILLATDQLLRVEELPVGASPDLVHHRRLEV